MTRPQYQGDRQRLLLAFDIGTTFSGISYSILTPGEVPEIKPVTRYLEGGSVGVDSKVPTVIYYDASGSARAIGAKTQTENTQAEAEDHDWSKAYWFKLHLRPKSKSTMGDEEKLPPLPFPHESVETVFADYMRYLYDCAQAYISETHPTISWESLKGDILYVLTHPNGWEGLQQVRMRKAAILAGLIPPTPESRSRILFVTEGEASLHFCLSNGLTMDKSVKGNARPGLLIVDAGGGTIDVTAYRKLPNDSFEEIAIPTCYFQGSTYVTARAEKDDESQRIQFTAHGARNEKLNIRGGRITLDGRAIASFFEPSVSCIIEAIKLQMDTAHFPIESVLLVGGFSASNWLFKKVREAIEPLGIRVFRPDSHVNKAVANGAVSFFLDGLVKSRVSRRSYGALCWTRYNQNDITHRKWSDRVRAHRVTGERTLDGLFDVVLPKDTRVTEEKEYRRSYRVVGSKSEDLNHSLVSVHSYRGENSNPQWRMDEPEQYVVECKVEADVSMVKRQYCTSTVDGRLRDYCEIEFDVVLLFGLTELKAQIAYMENDTEKRGPATVIYDDEEEGTALWGSSRRGLPHN